VLPACSKNQVRRRDRDWLGFWPRSYNCGVDVALSSLGSQKRAGSGGRIWLLVVTFALRRQHPYPSRSAEFSPRHDRAVREPPSTQRFFLSAFFTNWSVCHGLHVTAGIDLVAVDMLQIAVKGAFGATRVGGEGLLCFSLFLARG